MHASVLDIGPLVIIKHVLLLSTVVLKGYRLFLTAFNKII